MAEHSSIEWTDATWNPITGCSIVSPGCTNCYAMKLAGTRLRELPSRAGLTKPSKAGPVWTGEVRFNEGWLTQPLQWKRPRKIFVCAHGDLFAEGVPDEWIDKVFAVMALASQHTFQVLTKRAARMLSYLTEHAAGGGHVWTAGQAIEMPNGAPKPDRSWPLSNVWLGVSAERQKEAYDRIPLLLETPAAVHFVSVEPLLGPIDFDAIVPHPTAWGPVYGIERTLDWVIVGGESGPKARPMHPGWVRSLRDQCKAAGVAFHFKQWGEWHPPGSSDDYDTGGRGPKSLPRALMVANDGTVHRYEETARPSPVVVMLNVGKRAAGRTLDGRTWDEFPAVRA